VWIICVCVCVCGWVVQREGGEGGRPQRRREREKDRLKGGVILREREEKKDSSKIGKAHLSAAASH